MRLIFLGPPGAGKGTLAMILMERRKVSHLSSGNLLREAVQQGGPLGWALARTIRSGALVPDEQVTDLVLQRLRKFGPGDSFVLDGFPRTVDQARALDEALVQGSQGSLDLTVGFEVSSETMVIRLTGRRVCEQCGANYHLERLPPKQQGLCDRCGGPLKTRPDDNPETIVNRLNVYRKQTAPLLDYYRAQGKLRFVSGELGIEEQYQALIDVLEQERLVK